MAAILDLLSNSTSEQKISISFSYEIYFEKWYYMSFFVKKKINNRFYKIVVAAILELWMNKNSKLKVVSEMTCLYKIHIERWYYTSFPDEKCKIYIFLRWQLRPSWMYAQTISQNEKIVAEMSLVFGQIVQKFLLYWFDW